MYIHIDDDKKCLPNANKENKHKIKRMYHDLYIKHKTICKSFNGEH